MLFLFSNGAGFCELDVERAWADDVIGPITRCCIIVIMGMAVITTIITMMGG